MKKIIPKIEKTIEIYLKDPEEGFSNYLEFLKEIKPSLDKIILEGLRNPVEVGHISSRLLRDPIDIGTVIQNRTSEEKEAHVVGYLKAIIQLVYCIIQGLEGWQFINTSFYEECRITLNRPKIDTILSLIQMVEREVNYEKSLKLLKSNIKEKFTTMSKTFRDTDETTIVIENKQKFDYLYQSNDKEETDIPFTARLMAHYRAQESKKNFPLIIDPFAEHLAGDMSSYADRHKFIIQKSDYPIVRSYYIEKDLLTPWCKTNKKSQIVLLGAGLDTRVYRFKPLQYNTHKIFEVDLSLINNYKEELMSEEKPLCDLVRISTDLTDPNWASHLNKGGFSTEIPTFWIIEGLVYYLEKKIVISLLKTAAKMSKENSQIFVDICVPALAELVFGPFTRHFKWGLEKKDVPSFFEPTGWKVTCSYVDDHDQGREVGQSGLIFIHGVAISNFVKEKTENI